MLVTLAMLGFNPARAETVGSGTVLGEPLDIQVLDEFTADSKGRWTVTGSPNFEFTARFGRNIPAVAPSLLMIGVRTTVTDYAGPTWMTIQRNLEPDPSWSRADGLRVLMTPGEPIKWWVQFKVEDRNSVGYTKVMEFQYLPGRPIDHLIPFSQFKSEKGEAPNPATLAVLYIIGSVPGKTFYLDRVSLYQYERLSGWLSVATSRPVNNIYERGQEVELTITVGGQVPPKTAGLAYEITDDTGRKAFSGRRPLPTRGNPVVRVTVSPSPGYYEVRGWWVDARGKRLSPRSVVHNEGSVPWGVATFAVMPSTLAENLAGYKERGTGSFLGLHGDFLGMGDLIGLSWSNVYSRWEWDEQSKPDRAGGTARWSTDRQLPPYPGAPFRPHICPISGNFPPPDWALRKDASSPPAYDWIAYEAWLKDIVRAEKRLYGWMDRRIYEPAWEIDLNRPPNPTQKPAYTPAEIVELHRRCRLVIKQEDPGAVIIGPCPSTLDDDVMEWLESLFKAGLADQIDAVSIHGYHAPPPESADLPDKIAKLNRLTRQYAGRVLPIYSTEIGYPDTVGSWRDFLSQARHISRLAIILKGEGIRIFLPFYGIDYDAYNFGFCFNLEMDHPWGPWSTKRISPKPAAPALSQVSRVLEGALPVKRMSFPDPDIWGYVFEKDGRPIMVIWRTGEPKTIRIPVGRVDSLEVQDMMGRSIRIKASGGAVSFAVDGSPRYLLGAGREVLEP